MSRYEDDIRDQYGAPVVGAKVYVYDQNEDLATLTADGGGALTNPVTSDQYGVFSFNAADGVYALDFYYAGKRLFRDAAVQVGTTPDIPDSVLLPLSSGSGSTLIGFLPAGTDAVSRTAQAKLRDTINARDFGVLANGVTDDTAALARAIVAAITLKAELRLPGGRILVSSELIDVSTFIGDTEGPIIIRGQGINSTIIVNQCVGVSPFNVGNTYWCELSDFKVEGNGVTGAGGNGHAISAIDPDFLSGTDKPGFLFIRRLYITRHRGSAAKNYDGDDMPACGIYAANALGMVLDNVYIGECQYGAYLYKSYQPHLLHMTMFENYLASIVDDQNENLVITKADLISSDGASGGTITVHDGETMRAGSLCIYASHGTVLRDSKLKSHTFTAVSVNTPHFPVIEGNWIANDAVAGAVGIYSVAGARIKNNTFDRFGPFAGTRRDIHFVMGGGFNDIGEVSSNYFRYGGGGTTTALIEIDGTAANPLRGSIRDNIIGEATEPANAVTITDAVKVSGTAGNLQIEGNRILANANVNVTTGFNFSSTEGPGLNFTNNPIVTDGGAVTTQVSGLAAPFSTAGNSVDSSTLRYRRPTLIGSKTHDWADLATATQQSTTVTVTGAALGMRAEAWMDVALSGTRVWAEVTAADTVTVHHRNDTGGNVNVASGTLYASAEPRPF